MDLKWFIIFYCLTLCACEEDDSDKNLFPRLPVAPTKSDNELCRAESTLYVENLNNLTLWAYNMWDATAKSTTGTLHANTYQMGDWDECMKTRAPFKTQYCLARVTANISFLEPEKDPYSLERNPLGSVLRRIVHTSDISQLDRESILIGWCVPASCTLDDLETALNEDLKHSETLLIQHNVTYSGKLLEKLCQTQDDGKSFDLLDGAFCILFGAFFFMVIVATVYEFKVENELSEKEKQNLQKDAVRRILMGFSARKNFLDLAKADESNRALRPLYGVRTFAIFMIVIGHRFGTFSSGPVINLDEVEESYRSLHRGVVFHGDLFVDTFFVLSGLLVTYGLIIQYQKKFINPGFVIFLRYMRLTPLYMFVVFYYVTLLNYTGSGPLWKAVVYQESQDCRENWWLNLLYVHNYVNVDHICVLQTWYLACDLHYFIVALIIILVYIKNKKLGFTLFTLLFILSIVIPFVIVLIYLRPGMLFFYQDFLRDPKGHPDFDLTYIKSHTRAGAYFVGMIAGYIYYRMKDSETRLSKLKSHSITLVSIILLLVCLMTGATLYNPYHSYNAVEHAIFASLHRLPWSLGTIGLLLTASYGHTTVIEKVFSWSPFIPLSKLVYGAYLIHLTLHYRVLGITASSATFDIFLLCTWAMGEIVVSLAIALVLYIVIETPIRKLFKELLLRTRSTPSRPEESTRQDGMTTISPRESDSRL